MTNPARIEDIINKEVYFPKIETHINETSQPLDFAVFKDIKDI